MPISMIVHCFTESREITSVTGTLPRAGREAFGLALLKSPEVLQIIEGLGYSGANIQVIDDQRRVRAETGNYRGAGPVPLDGDLLPDLWFRFIYGSDYSCTKSEF